MRYAATVSRRRILILAAIVTALLPLRAVGGDEVRPSACVPLREMRLAGFTFDDDAKKVHQRFRRPLASRAYAGTDDGGEFTYREETFRGITFTFGRDQSLDGVTVTSPLYPLPSGVRVGMTLDEVARRLRFSTDGVHPSSTVTLSDCDSFDAAELELTFDAEEPKEVSAESRLVRIATWITYD